MQTFHSLHAVAKSAFGPILHYSLSWAYAAFENSGVMFNSCID